MSASDGWTISAQTAGTVGAVCWSVQLLPQIWKNYREQSTLGLQPSMMLLWALAGVPLGIYNILRSFPVALQIQPQILTFLSLLTWAQCYYYVEGTERVRRSRWWCIMALASLCCLFGGVEAGVIFAIKTSTQSKTATQVEYWWPVVLMGVLAGVLLCAGVSRHYIDIYKERTVRGISFLFCGIDALGDLTSLISVVLWYRAGKSLDIVGICVYASEFVMWSGVFACGARYNLRSWLKLKTQRDASSDADSPDSRPSIPRSPSSTAFQTASARCIQDIALNPHDHSLIRLRPILHSEA